MRVDRCHHLGARRVVGSHGIEDLLVRLVIEPHIFDEAASFAARVAEEIAERRKVFRPMPDGLVHLKESPGGLREIDLSLAIAKARLRVWDPSRPDRVAEIGRIDPARAPLYEGLGEAYDFLVALRSAYRVTVVASDEIERSRLEAPARILGYGNGTRDAADRLFEDVGRRMAAAAALVDELLSGVGAGGPRLPARRA